MSRDDIWDDYRVRQEIERQAAAENVIPLAENATPFHVLRRGEHPHSRRNLKPNLKGRPRRTTEMTWEEFAAQWRKDLDKIDRWIAQALKEAQRKDRK